MVALQGLFSFNSISLWIKSGGFEQLTRHPWANWGIECWTREVAHITAVFPSISAEDLDAGSLLLHVSKSLADGMSSYAVSILGNISSYVAKFFLMLLVFYWVVRDEAKIVKYIFHLSPLPASQEDKIIQKIRSVARSALLLTFLIAMVQGTLGGVGFWIAGLPGLFWGTVMAFASLIPIFGAAVVWVPASIYFFVTGQGGWGIFIVAWSAILVSPVDNVLRPYFMKEAADMSTALVFLSILGGVSYFGLLGLIYGPLIYGITAVLLYIYNAEFRPLLGCTRPRLKDRDLPPASTSTVWLRVVE